MISQTWLDTNHSLKLSFPTKVFGCALSLNYCFRFFFFAARSLWLAGTKAHTCDSFNLRWYSDIHSKKSQLKSSDYRTSIVTVVSGNIWQIKFDFVEYYINNFLYYIRPIELINCSPQILRQNCLPHYPSPTIGLIRSSQLLPDLLIWSRRYILMIREWITIKAGPGYYPDTLPHLL